MEISSHLVGPELLTLGPSSTSAIFQKDKIDIEIDKHVF